MKARALILPNLSEQQAQKLNHLASELQLEIINHPDTDTPVFLTMVDDKVALQMNQQGVGPVYVDFSSGPLAHRRLYGSGKKQILGRALGLKHGFKTVIDANAGLGRDAFAMCCMGLNVTAIERSDLLFALLKDAFARGREDIELSPFLTKNLTFIHGDAIAILNELGETEKPEVIYLDPMFPEKKKSALAAKEMQLLQQFIPHNLEEDEMLLEAALQAAQKRVVVKRSLHAPPILDQVNHEFLGKTVRYDVYLC